MEFLAAQRKDIHIISNQTRQNVLIHGRVGTQLMGQILSANECRHRNS